MAIFCAVLAVTAAVAGFAIPYAPKIDFDVIGFMYVLTNLPKLTAWFMAYLFGSFAVGAWIKSRAEP